MPRWLTTPIAEIWKDLNTDETLTMMRWIDQAERLIQARFSTIDERITAGTLDRAVVGDVVEAMVTRRLETQRRGGVDKIAYPEISMEWGDGGGAGSGSAMFLTMDELLLLTPPQASGQAFTIRRKPTPRSPW